jgi:hypothetical protein
VTDAIYLIQSDGQLVDMRVQAHESENLLQAFIAKYPSALAGDQMNMTSPRRWLLISREATVPSEDGGPDRWYVDHLFLDQDAVPTLVEVKRSTDTRIRREVVGQMLDYAANAVVYWPVEAIRAKFEATCQVDGLEPSQELTNFLGDSEDPEQFWQTVKTNMQAGRIRMVFLADAIPPELRRVIEFLNGQMDPAEVIAVEVKQYVGSGLKALVPRVLGQTVEAQNKKSAGPREARQWDRDSFLQALADNKGKGAADVARQILSWAEHRGLRMTWGLVHRTAHSLCRSSTAARPSHSSPYGRTAAWSFSLKRSSGDGPLTTRH